MADDPYRVAGQIRRDLDTITALYGLALRRPAGEKVTARSRTWADVVSAEILDTRRNVITDLGWHVRVIRRTIKPTPAAPNSGVLALSEFVGRWALLLAEQDPDAAATCARDVQRHARNLRALVQGDGLRVISLGRCPLTTWADPDDVSAGLTHCPGELTTRFSRLTRPGEIRCDATDTHVWAPKQWHELGQKVAATLQNGTVEPLEPPTRYDDTQEA